MRPSRSISNSRRTWNSPGLAYDGLEALELATTTRPDIIVLDITMPYLDGIGVLERLGQLDLEPGPRVIILTAFEQESMIQRLIGLGASYYMVKPFDVNTLLTGSASSPGPRMRRQTSGKKGMKTRARLREKTANELELEVSKLFHEMGIPAHFRGYAYLRDAIIIAVREVEVLGNITKNLYPALRRSTGRPRAESSRPSGTRSRSDGSGETLSSWSGFSAIPPITGAGRFPTSASFIAKVADGSALSHAWPEAVLDASPLRSGGGLFGAVKQAPPPAQGIFARWFNDITDSG